MKKRLLLAAALAVVLCFWRGARPAEALTNTSCAGNVCTGTATVGGQVIAYAWTQNHGTTDSSLRVKFTSGPYAASANPVRFKITVSTPFSLNSSLKNPSPTTSIPPDQTINLGNTIIERSSTSSAAGTTYDFVQELRFATPSPGTFAVTLEFAQYGATQIVGPFNVYVDAVSPNNRNEGASLSALYGASYKQCYDATDNDLDYRQDCADSDCLGQGIGGGSVCESPETTCNDGLDNDGNAKTDCADPLCNGKAGNLAGTKFCGPENGGANHANCADGFDNDGNGKTDCTDDAFSSGCWKTGFQDCAKTETSCIDNIDNDRDQDYSNAIDANAGTGVDCRDYDCKGQGNCTTNERLRWDQATSTFIDTPAQCFDGIDNDLDALKDCADPDCLGATFGAQHCSGHEAYLPPSALDPTGVSTPAFYFNYCNDGLDNDGDGLVDGADPDCKNVFGECAPPGTVGLAATENISFLSCADAIDNDANGSTDCADNACRTNGKLGRGGCLNASCGAPAKYDPLQTDAAACASTENSANLCGDGLDNNGNGQADCADAGCSGVRHGPTIGSSGTTPYTCGTESGVSACHDGADNNSNGNTDCFDAACQDGTQCARRPGAGGWTLAPTCLVIPDMTPLTAIVSGGFVNVSHEDRLYVNTPYAIRFTGAGSFTSLTVVIGDAVNPANAFPFNASTGNCALSGTGAAQMRYASPSSSVGVITENGGATINGFDVTLTCAVSSAVPLGPKTFKVAVVANHAGTVEFGDMALTTQVYENTPPTLPSPATEVEAIVGGKVNVPVGGSIRFQAVPNTDPSGICRCDFSLGGVSSSSPDGNCVATAGPFANDNAAFQVSSAAVDGASNKSATSTQTIAINVVPSVVQDLTLGVDANGATVTTYRSSDAVNLSTKFQTDTLSTFPIASTCRVFVYDPNWVGGQAATVSMTPTAIGNTLICQGVYNVPAALAAGRYWIFVEATDSSGDVVRSNAQSFLKCDNADVGTGACKDADFDHDGTPEGRYTPGAFPSPPTPTYFGAPQPHACDNCINFYNPNQKDLNANGVGDSCEASAVGRCKYKYCGSAPNDPTPGGSCSTDADCTAGDRCIVVDQPMCTVNCAVDADCQPPNTAVVGSCSLDWGQCAGGADQGNCCFSNDDCLSGICKALVQPFLQTVSGQVYSAGDLQASETPPVFNATYCLQSSGAITNFTSEHGCALSGSPAYTIPKKETNYVGSFGAIDVAGILNGKYGAPTTPSSVPNQLNGGIYYFPSGLTIAAPLTFQDSSGSARANGLVVVKGDLTINAALAYQNQNESDLKNLASVGWLVLKNDDGTGGNVFINGSITSVVGAFFAESTIDTGDGTSQLDATGAFVAKNFALKRQFASRTGGSEKVTFDARLILNPPPGLSDAARSLPGFRAVPGQ